MNTYNLYLKDGSVVSSENLEWRTISTKQSVIYMGGTKSVFTCNLDVVKIILSCDEISTEVDIPEGCQMYRAFRAIDTIINGEGKPETVGQCVGIVKNGTVVEERVISISENSISGWRL